ncbi:MAG: DeoR family transcriptional regulator [Candidatus Magasanikbacteria bacterium]|nr:DeoR family transcriptional regulator [Candidatus Magasanikbacteria bacterium]
METRQEQLLQLVIENYIKTAEPVGSRFLVTEAGLAWSEATVRNDLRELEEAGYLTHPHTSAGRIPTTKGYRHYIQKLNFSGLELPKKESSELEKAFKAEDEWEAACKQLAKTMVALSTETVLLAFSSEKVYYTGLASLFQKPDFGEQSLVVDVSAMFDTLDEVLPDFFNIVAGEPKYFLGAEHPFGEKLTVLSTRFGEDDQSLIALVGPQRMDYKHNWALLNNILQFV